MTAPENAIIKHGHAEYAALCEDTALSMNVYCAVSVGTCTYDIMTTPEVFAAVAKRLEPQWAICRNWKADGERFKAHRSLMPYFSDSIEVETWHHDEPKDLP